VLATTEGALDPLDHHRAIRTSPWQGRVIPTFRPDDVVDPDRDDFVSNLQRLGAVTGEDVSHWGGYLAALAARRAAFRAHGATATDHGHPTARTADLAKTEAQAPSFDEPRMHARKLAQVLYRYAKLFSCRRNIAVVLGKYALDDIKVERRTGFWYARVTLCMWRSNSRPRSGGILRLRGGVKPGHFWG
jgi:hypothetical protein